MIKKFSVIQLANINPNKYKGVITRKVTTIVINCFRDPFSEDERLAVFIFLCNSTRKKVSKKFATNLFNMIRSFGFSELKRRNIRDYYFSKSFFPNLDKEGINEIKIIKYFWNDFDKNHLIRSLYEEYV